MSASIASSSFASRAGTPSSRLSRRCKTTVSTRAVVSHHTDADSTDRITMPRRVALSLAVGITLPSITNVLIPSFASSSSASVIITNASLNLGSKDFDFKTYKLTVPDVYEEVFVPLGAKGIVSPTVMLLRDSRPGQAGNTISLSKQIIPQGGISSVSDIGTSEEAAKRLVAAEGSRSKGIGGLGGAGATFIDANERIGGPQKLLYYTAEYSKNVLSVGRTILTTLVVADGVLYTLTCEEDTGRFEQEMGDALRKTTESLVIMSSAEKAV